MLRFRYRMTRRNLPKAEGRLENGHGSGPAGRISKMRKLVTALLRHERIEGKHAYIDEARGYAERVIYQHIRRGHSKVFLLAQSILLDTIYLN